MDPERNEQKREKLPARIISAAGILALLAAYLYWVFNERPDAAGIAARVTTEG